MPVDVLDPEFSVFLAAAIVLAVTPGPGIAYVVARTAAGNVGLKEPMELILEVVESYWLEGEDIIPDEMGIIGLLDDAYSSLTSMQMVSDHYQL